MLVIESDDFFRRSLLERLRLDGQKVFEAGEETMAEKTMHTKNVDVVLLGLGGLKQRALSILEKIKKIRPFTEVILMTPIEQHSLSLSMAGMKLGAFDEILVPFEMDVLVARIREAHELRKGRLGGRLLHDSEASDPTTSEPDAIKSGDE